MYDFINNTEYYVNSMHNMIATKEKVEEFAKISSFSDDGLVESFELSDKEICNRSKMASRINKCK